MKYSAPMSRDEIILTYPEKANDLLSCPIHKFRAESGIELIHEEPEYLELDRIYANWQLMSDKQKCISDIKSIELFGIDNETHYTMLCKNKF